MPRFLMDWLLRLRRHRTPIMLAAGICGALGMMALLFWFQPNRGTLADFVYVRSFVIPAIPKNLSGITYNPESKTLFLISNNPCRIYEMTPQGGLLRQINLVDFYDTEDIVFVEGQTFAVIEELRNAISIFQIWPETEAVRYADCRHIFVLPPTISNTGLEGLSWDPVTRDFLVAHESNPRAIYAIPFDSTAETIRRGPEIPELRNLPWIKLGNYSGIHFDNTSRRLLILSRKTKNIKDYSLDGHEKGSLNLSRAISGIVKAEGLTFAPGGKLYVCSEPNIVSVFSRSQR